MTIYAPPGGTFTPYVSNAPTGDAGSIGFRLHDPVTNTDVIARFTAGIIESPAASGIYYTPAQTAPLTAGTYQLIWDSPSSPPNAVEDLIVTYSALPNQDLCSLDDVRQALKLTATGGDALIADLITAASSAITHRYQREFTDMGTLTRTFEVNSDRIDLAPYDLQSIDTISLYPEETPLAVTRYADYDLRPVGQTSLGTYTSLILSGFLVVLNQNVFRYGTANIAITGRWGAPSIHPDVRRGAVITVVGWFDRSATDYGLPDMMQDGAISQPDRPSTWAIPAAAHRLFQSFERQVYA